MDAPNAQPSHAPAVDPRKSFAQLAEQSRQQLALAQQQMNHAMEASKRAIDQAASQFRAATANAGQQTPQTAQDPDALEAMRASGRSVEAAIRAANEMSTRAARTVQQAMVQAMNALTLTPDEPASAAGDRPARDA
jgi:hypothetical protein